MLRKLYETFPGVHDVIISNTLTRFRIDVDSLPSWEDTDSAVSYRAPLCRDYGCPFHTLMMRGHTADEDRENGVNGGSGTGSVRQAGGVVMAETNEINYGVENSVASFPTSGYNRSSSSDSMPELVCCRGDSQSRADVVSAAGTYWTGHVVSHDPSG